MGPATTGTYIPELLGLVRTGAIDPSTILTQIESVHSVLEAYQQFDDRSLGWIKSALAAVDRRMSSCASGKGVGMTGDLGVHPRRR
jgi:hypothetical protein